MQNLMTTIKFLYGDVDQLQMPLENVEELFAPMTPNGVSSKDYRFRTVIKSDSGDFEFDGDIDDWRMTLIEISLNQRLTVMEQTLSKQLDMIHSHVKHLRCTLESLIDPQRGVVSDDS